MTGRHYRRRLRARRMLRLLGGEWLYFSGVPTRPGRVGCPFGSRDWSLGHLRLLERRLRREAGVWRWRP